MNDKCCGKCKWHQYYAHEKDWACTNEDSEYTADFTGYKDCCDEYEGRD